MTWKFPVAGCLFACAVIPNCWAAPPQINEITPFGVRRGEPSQIRIAGANLSGNPRLVAPFKFSVNPRPETTKGSDAAHWTPEVVVPAEVAIGVYPVRIQTDDGISNPFLFAVGQLPRFAEVEDNSTFEKAQQLPALPLVVEGTAQANDVDYFRFAGKKGETIVLDAQCARIGSGVDPTIRLTKADASRTFIASADESPGLLTDCRLAATLPDDGDYVVELSDSRYQGGGRPVYRLLIGPIPMAEELFPLGARAGETVGLELRGGTVAPASSNFVIAAATPRRLTALDWFQLKVADPGINPTGPGGARLDIESLSPLIVGRLPELRESTEAGFVTTGAPPVVFNGRLDRPGETDRFKIAVAAGQRLAIKVQAASLGSTIDGVLQVLGAKDAVIGNADDQTVAGPKVNNQPTTFIDPDPALDLTVPAGTTEITLALRDLEGRGGIGYPYRIIVQPIVSTFELTAADAQISIPKGGTAAVPVTLVRKGFNGEVTVTVDSPPAGLTVRPGHVAAGQLVGTLTLAASADAAFNALPLKLVGRGQDGTTPVEVVATHTVRFVEQGGVPINSMIFEGLEAAPAQPDPVNLTTPAEPIEVAHGFGASIPVGVVRSKGSDAALTISPLTLPPGLAAPNATVAEKADKGAVAVTAAVETAFGSMTIGLVAKGKFANVDRTFALPAVTLKMVRPAEAQLAAAAVELKPGATFELKGKLVRRGAFKDPVTIKLNGLPAGLTAAPLTVAADATDFVVKVVADAKAAPATAKAQLALGFQVNKKDYPTPPVDLAVKVLAAK